MSDLDWYYRLPLPQIHEYSSKYGLDPLLVAAIIKKESGGRTWATRFEPHCDVYLVHYRDWASKLGITPETERLAQMHSYGLMQVMGFVAREIGFNDLLPRLCDPKVGLDYGCRKLQSCFQKYGDAASSVSAYNQGSPRKTPGGMFQNQKNYVDPVFNYYRSLRDANLKG